MNKLPTTSKSPAVPHGLVMFWLGVTAGLVIAAYAYGLFTLIVEVTR